MEAGGHEGEVVPPPVPRPRVRVGRGGPQQPRHGGGAQRDARQAQAGLHLVRSQQIVTVTVLLDHELHHLVNLETVLSGLAFGW